MYKSENRLNVDVLIDFTGISPMINANDYLSLPEGWGGGGGEAYFWYLYSVNIKKFECNPSLIPL